jgi:hypothetical protein
MIKTFGRTYYTLAEAARMAHCAKSRLYALRRAGLLRCACLTPEGASRWEYHCTREALLEALECELPGRPPAARPAPRRSLEERDREARKILREKFGMRV